MKNERELFETWYLQHYYTRNGLKPDGDIFKKYHDGDGWTYLYDPVFSAWVVWQASANREGFKLVPVEASELMLDEGLNCEHEIDNFVVIDEIYKAMIGSVNE